MRYPKKPRPTEGKRGRCTAHTLRPYRPDRKHSKGTIWERS